jgi:ArsR family transcriptional regulator, arsenate/arsenite/antimonite-responsive transcriptional repressor
VAVKDIAQFFKVLADEARLKILWLLFNHRELCVCDILEALEITQSKASRHLATLRHAGLVIDRKVGTWAHYSLREVEGELKRAQLKALRARLADQPGAVLVLRKLHQWLERKDVTRECGNGSACQKTTIKAQPAPRLAPRQRGTR